jgi:hypothetical protein
MYDRLSTEQWCKDTYNDVIPIYTVWFIIYPDKKHKNKMEKECLWGEVDHKKQAMITNIYVYLGHKDSTVPLIDMFNMLYRKDKTIEEKRKYFLERGVDMKHKEIRQYDFLEELRIGAYEFYKEEGREIGCKLYDKRHRKGACKDRSDRGKTERYCRRT